MTSTIERWKPELDACLEASFYALSISFRASPGMKAFGFTYSKKGNPLIVVLLVVGKWLYCRLHRISMYKNWRDAAEGSLAKKLWRLLKIMDAVVQVLSFANQLSFISTNVSSEAYPDLTSRLSGYSYAPMQPPRSSSSRHHATSSSILTASASASTGVGASRAEAQLLTRHAAWEVLQGLAMAITLFCDWKQLTLTMKRYSIDMYYRAMHLLQHSFSVGGMCDAMLVHKKYIPETLLPFFELKRSRKARGAGSSSLDEKRAFKEKDNSACAICAQHPPEAPHIGECGHVCCFYCLSTNVRMGRFRCPTCGISLTYYQRYRG